MAQESTLRQFTRLAGQISGKLSEVDLGVFEKTEQRALMELKRLATDARLDIRDWEYADTRYEREKHGKNAVERLELLRARVLSTSEFGIFGAADVAQLSAQIDAVVGRVG